MEENKLMYELPFAGWTDAQVKEEMYYLLYQLSRAEGINIRLDSTHINLILKYLDVVSREENK